MWRLGRAWGRVHGPTLAAIAARGMCPGPGVVGNAVPAPAAPAKLSRRLLPGPAPLHAVRVQQGDAPSLRSVTLPAWPLPAFRSATVFPRAPHLSRAVLRPRCARARPAPVAPWSAMSNRLDTATRFPSSRLRRSPDPRCRRPPPGYVMPRACPRRLGQPRGTPSPPALPTRNRCP